MNLNKMFNKNIFHKSVISKVMPWFKKATTFVALNFFVPLVYDKLFLKLLNVELRIRCVESKIIYEDITKKLFARDKKRYLVL